MLICLSQESATVWAKPASGQRSGDSRPGGGMGVRGQFAAPRMGSMVDLPDRASQFSGEVAELDLTGGPIEAVLTRTA